MSVRPWKSTASYQRERYKKRAEARRRLAQRVDELRALVAASSPEVAQPLDEPPDVVRTPDMHVTRVQWLKRHRTKRHTIWLARERARLEYWLAKRVDDDDTHQQPYEQENDRERDDA